MPVVDASVVVDWVAPGADPDEAPGRLLSQLVRQGAPILAPRLLIEETANALTTGIRRGRWSGADADLAYGLLRRLPVRLVDGLPDMDRAWELSRRFDEHPVYDMVYVALAERLGVTFVTADDALVRRLTTLPFVVAVAQSGPAKSP